MEGKSKISTHFCFRLNYNKSSLRIYTLYICVCGGCFKRNSKVRCQCRDFEPITRAAGGPLPRKRQSMFQFPKTATWTFILVVFVVCTKAAATVFPFFPFFFLF